MNTYKKGRKCKTQKNDCVLQNLTIQKNTNLLIKWCSLLNEHQNQWFDKCDLKNVKLFSANISVFPKSH